MYSYMDNSADLSDIPEEFYSEETGKLFTHCLVCNRNLLYGDVLYLIEKVVRQYRKYNTYDIIFEYAICIDCSERMKEQLSNESQENIQNYFMDHIEQLNLDPSKAVPLPTKNACYFKGTKKKDLDEYQLCSTCIGKKIIPNQIPYLVGSQAIEEISQLLSNKTSDNMDRFIDSYFGVPTVLKNILKENKVLLL